MPPRSHTTTLFRALTACVLAAPALALGNVLVVDASGSGDYAGIQTAVDAATEGDVILVRNGRYASFSITAKSLVVVVEPGAAALVDGAIRTRNLIEGQTVVLSGLQAFGSPQISKNDKQYGLRIKNCVGHVRVQDCALTGAAGIPGSEHPDSWEGALVQTNEDIAFTRCAIRGGPGHPDVVDFPAGNGLNSFQCDVRLYDCAVSGGAGRGSDRTAGGEGYQSLDSFLFASNTALRGGDGNAGACPCGEGGDGGDGIHTSAPARTALVGCTVQGGAGGASCAAQGCPGLPDGSPGAAFVGSGPHAVLGDVRRGMSLPALAREATVVHVVFTGQPGDRALAIFAERADSEYVPDRGGVLLVDVAAASVVRDFGVVPASGTLDVPLPIAELDPSVESRVVHLQALFVDASGRLFLASPRSLAVVDQAF